MWSGLWQKVSLVKVEVELRESFKAGYMCILSLSI